jgi:outer membrane immunogenic protein
LKPPPIDYERRCIDQLNPQPKADILNRVATEQHRPEICGRSPGTHGWPFSDGNSLASGDRHEEAGNHYRRHRIDRNARFCDLAVKAPLPAPAPVLSWSGWYVGLNAGGTWASDHSVDTVSTPVPGIPDAFLAATSAAGATGSVSVGSNAGFIGGGQIGYNWQFAPVWVGGLEADIQGIGHGSNSGTLNTTGTVPGGFFIGDTINTQITSTSRVDWLGTVRGRVGYLWTPALLVYGTGGLAYGDAKASTSITQSNNDCINFGAPCAAPNAATAGSLSQTRDGWTAGGGFEWMFAPRWSAKVEYLYYDLGSVTFSNGNLVTGAGSLPQPQAAIVTSQSTARFNGSIARIGINYHF